MKLIASVAVAVAMALALAPRSPQAADVERVQRACAELRREYGTVFEKLPTSAEAADNAHAYQWPAQRSKGTRVTIPVVDMRLFELFCH